MASEGFVKVRVENHVATVVLANEAHANSLTPEMHPQLQATWTRLDADPQVKAAVITAEGERHFCAGADLTAVSKPGTMVKPGQAGKWTPRQNNFSKPVIAAINGTVAGGGMFFVVDVDIVLASQNASFVDPHVALGQVSSYSLLRAALSIGLAEAAYLGIAGREMSAARAYQLGIVQELHDSPDAVRSAAHDLAMRIASFSPAAVRITLRNLRQMVSVPHEQEVLARSMAETQEHWDHPDASEGPRARIDGRPPVWASDGLFR